MVEYVPYEVKDITTNAAGQVIAVTRYYGADGVCHSILAECIRGGE